MHALTREAVASFPELANWAPLALVVDTFLMWAADDAVGHGDGQHVVGLDEVQDLLSDAGVVAHVAGVELPIAHLTDFRALGRNDADGDLAGPVRVGAVGTEVGRST